MFPHFTTIRMLVMVFISTSSEVEFKSPSYFYMRVSRDNPQKTLTVQVFSGHPQRYLRDNVFPSVPSFIY